LHESGSDLGLALKKKRGRPSATSGMYWLIVAALPKTGKGLLLTLLLSMTFRASFVFCATVRGMGRGWEVVVLRTGGRGLG